MNFVLYTFEITYMLLTHDGKFDSSTMIRAILYDNKIALHECKGINKYYEVYIMIIENIQLSYLKTILN